MKISEILKKYDNFGWKFEILSYDDKLGIALTADDYTDMIAYNIRVLIDDGICNDNIPHIIRVFFDKNKALKAYKALTMY